MQVSDALDGPQLLLVEDDPGQALVMQEHLKTMAPAMVRARSRAEADYFLQRSHFDLVILDIDLPDGSGFDIQSDLRNASASPPVLFVTADQDAESAVRALESGASGYVVKRPGFAARLTDRVAALLASKATATASSAPGARELADSAMTLVHQFGKELFWITTHAKRLETLLGSERGRKRASAIRTVSEDMAVAARQFLERSTGKPRRDEKIGLQTALERASAIVSRIHGEGRVICERRESQPIPRAPAHMVDAIVCLLDNALRASSSHETAHVELHANGFTISDRGVGMSAELLANCRQRGVSTRSNAGGHGVGLFVAVQIVERAGGCLDISSRLGSGTTVEVHLPSSPV